MNFLEELNAKSENKENLEVYLKENIDIVYDFFLSQSFLEITNYRREIEKYILSRFDLLKNLDLDNKTNSAFLLILLEVSERFGFQLSFKRLYRVLVSSDVQISQRLQAADLYSSGMRQLSNFETVLVEMLSQLEDAYQNEEDDIDGILSIIVNFYAHIVLNFGEFNPSGVNKIKNQFSVSKEIYFILQGDLITKILEIDTLNFSLAYNEIQRLLDEYLKRSKFNYPLEIDSFHLEKGTTYSKELLNMEFSLANLLRMNNILYSEIKDDKYYHALGRGVNVLEREEHMLAYMYAYGQMHIAKLNRAISMLPQKIENAEVIDWGCGQGLASMVLIDKLGLENLKAITLIEPSSICLKRASLHLTQKLNSIRTINKDFDSLNLNDFEIIPNNSQSYIHLFSNILDVDLFSLSHLIQLIHSKFKGTNFFVISSPFITNLKTARIDSFIDSFEGKYDVEIYYKSEKRRGEWLQGWTKVIRVLKVEIE